MGSNPTKIPCVHGNVALSRDISEGENLPPPVGDRVKFWVRKTEARKKVLRTKTYAKDEGQIWLQRKTWRIQRKGSYNLLLPHQRMYISNIYREKRKQHLISFVCLKDFLLMLGCNYTPWSCLIRQNEGKNNTWHTLMCRSGAWDQELLMARFQIDSRNVKKSRFWKANQKKINTKNATENK